MPPRMSLLYFYYCWSFISHPGTDGSYLIYSYLCYTGGAVSMAITDAVTQFHTKSHQQSGGKHKHVCPQSLRWMEMQYLSPCKGKVSISIVPQPSTKNGTLPPNNSLEHIHSFRVMVYACKKSGAAGSKDISARKCLAHGSVLFY